MRRPRLCRRSRSAARNSSPGDRPSNRNPETIEPSAGCNCVTRTPAGRAESETSLTELLAADMFAVDMLAVDMLAVDMGPVPSIDGSWSNDGSNLAKLSHPGQATRATRAGYS